MVSESTLTLDILPLSADTARLVRVYGTEPCIALPGTLPAPEGGSFAVTELGDYCFSEKPRSLPAADKTCRYEAAPDGTARLIRAFGQTVGGTCRRYDFDFDAPAAGSDADDLHPVCGNFLEELTLPDSLQVVGSCAFYNCRKLRLLTVGTGSLTMGSDVFLNISGSNASGSAARTRSCLVAKVMVASSTPGRALIFSSILEAQWAQPRFSMM